MSAAAAVETAVPVRSGKNKLVQINVAALVPLLAAAGGVALLVMKKQAQAQDEADAEGTSQTQQSARKKRDPSVVSAFVPQHSFTVDLAGRDIDRFAQAGISLQRNDARAGSRSTLFMPAKRNNILMVLSHKHSSDLPQRSGKARPAHEVQRETGRALGLEPAAPGAVQGDAAPPRRVCAAHFSNFIIQ